ncbi:MAG: hypothetical protein VX589_15895 [Myxococcota bacterium]|nr:hypothetical protein [Myxococcota bacterium]
MQYRSGLKWGVALFILSVPISSYAQQANAKNTRPGGGQPALKHCFDACSATMKKCRRIAQPNKQKMCRDVGRQCNFACKQTASEACFTTCETTLIRCKKAASSDLKKLGQCSVRGGECLKRCERLSLPKSQ